VCEREEKNAERESESDREREAGGEERALIVTHVMCHTHTHLYVT